MSDSWNEREIEINGEEEYSWANFAITPDGGLEIATSRGLNEDYRHATVEFSPERTPEILAGLENWLTGLKGPRPDSVSVHAPLEPEAITRVSYNDYEGRDV